jgi:apoptosis-inducing factor 2
MISFFDSRWIPPIGCHANLPSLLFQIQCVGQKPNSSLVSSLAPTSTTSSGHIKVLPSLQVDCSEPGFDRMFAAGDVIDRNPARNARAAYIQALIAAQNVVRAIEGKPLSPYEPQWMEPAINLTVGLVGRHNDPRGRFRCI